MFDQREENSRNDAPRESHARTLRLVRIALKRERWHTERLLNGLLHAVSIEIERVEERVHHKLDQIDTSLSLIAREIARRSDDPPSGETGP